MKLFFYDTETQGLPDFRAPSAAPGQPHIVQFAGALVDTATRRVIASVDLIVRPDGWVIPPEVAAVHGITTERAAEVGLPEAEVLSIAMSLWRRADCRVAHNEEFDARILRIAQHRFNRDVLEDWDLGQAHCTAAMSTDICKIPPTPRMVAAGFRHFKKPKLSEAHSILLGYELENAHSAMADVEGCMRIYWTMLDRAQTAAA